MQIGDLVIMKSKPTSMGIVVGLFDDIYDRGFQGTEVWHMATVLWNGCFGEASFEVDRLEVIG